MKKWRKIFLGVVALPWICRAHPMPDVDFKNLVPPARPNFALLCPAGECQAKHKRAPVFSESVSQLQARTLKIILAQARTEQKQADESKHQFHFVQRSRWMGFPDFITVQFFDLGAKGSSLAILSRSVYGYYDFGVNQRRVQHYLDLLQSP